MHEARTCRLGAVIGRPHGLGADRDAVESGGWPGAAGRVGARCEGRGILSIGSPPDLVGNYVLPGNNYHVFDYSLFWANVRADAERRVAAFDRR